MINERGPLTYLFSDIAVLAFVPPRLSHAVISRRRYRLIHVQLSVPGFSRVRPRSSPSFWNSGDSGHTRCPSPNSMPSKFTRGTAALSCFAAGFWWSDCPSLFANHCHRGQSSVVRACRQALQDASKSVRTIRNYPASDLLQPEHPQNRGKGKFLITYPGSLNLAPGR